MWRTLKAAEARRLIGQEVRWRSIYSGWTSAGLVHEVRGKNIHIGADWQWLPDIQIEVPPADPQGEEVPR